MPIKEKPTPEEKRKGRRKKRLSYKVPEENPAGRKRIFKPPDSDHFHFAADNTKKEKLNRAIEELIAFVEFDESLSKWEKDLIESVKKKKHPVDEEVRRVERIRALVELLRVK